jgi:DNA helicase-2/ATP-dependent DNA helicase PcrA
VEGLKAIKHFWKECAANAPDVLEIEKDFTLLLGQHSIKGKVDRVDRGAGKEGVRVFDYKTGRAKETLETEDKEQLWLYQVALEERGLTVERLAYVFVLDWKEVEVEPLKDKKREEFLEKLTKRMDDILASEFQPTPEPFTCKYCDFKNICEYKKV